jgi:phage tail-like protein
MKQDYEILTTSRFYLELSLAGSQSLIDGYFMECQGFKRTQEAIEICEVTPQKWGSKDNKYGRVVRTKIPGLSKSSNLTLRFGLTISDTMWKWFKSVEEGNWSKERKDGDLTIYDQGAIERARYRFIGAWPISYKISDLQAGSSDFQIEELELVVDEFFRVTQS